MSEENRRDLAKDIDYLDERLTKLEKRERDKRKRKKANLIKDNINDFLPYWKAGRHVLAKKPNTFIGKLFGADVLLDEEP